MRKNVSGQIVSASLVSRTDGSAVTTGTTTVYVTGDGGTQASGGGTVTHEGNGEWSYAPTQAETNYTHIAFTFTNTNAVGQTLNVYTVGQDFTAAQLNANVTQISGDSVAADNLEAAADGAGYNLGGGSVTIAGLAGDGGRLLSGVKGNVKGVVGVGSTTTSVVTSSLDPSASATDQFKGRIVTFLADTTTAALRGQATDITASTAGGVLTVTALTTAPASGDTFVIT